MNEQEFLQQYSVDALTNLALTPPAPTQGPLGYGPQPDGSYEIGGIQAPYNNVLPMIQAPARTTDSAGNAALGNWRPPMQYSGPKRPTPVVGRDLDIGQVTDWIRKKESSGNYTALNREKPGNTASGAYQYTDGTWNGYGGYSKAMLAPKHIQDRRFQEDIAARARRYGGDPFKMIAAHYLPAVASDPSLWTKPYKLKNGQTVKPAAAYVAYVVRGTPLERHFNEYISQY